MGQHVASCAGCRFNGGPYVQADNPERTGLKCALHAPLATGGMMDRVMTIWPMVQPDEWCGDFESVDGFGWRMPTQPEPVEQECPF